MGRPAGLTWDFACFDLEKCPRRRRFLFGFACPRVYAHTCVTVSEVAFFVQPLDSFAYLEWDKCMKCRSIFFHWCKDVARGSSHVFLTSRSRVSLPGTPLRTLDFHSSFPSSALIGCAAVSRELDYQLSEVDCSEPKPFFCVMGTFGCGCAKGLCVFGWGNIGRSRGQEILLQKKANSGSWRDVSVGVGDQITGGSNQYGLECYVCSCLDFRRSSACVCALPDCCLSCILSDAHLGWIQGDRVSTPPPHPGQKENQCWELSPWGCPSLAKS